MNAVSDDPRGLQTSLPCPRATCRTENPADAERCIRCQVPLRGYARLTVYAARLFNEGLRAARCADITRARELFAAVVFWCPMDVQARHALAMASLAQDDLDGAEGHWTVLKKRSPSDDLATRGLAAVQARKAARLVSQGLTGSADIVNRKRRKGSRRRK